MYGGGGGVGSSATVTDGPKSTETWSVLLVGPMVTDVAIAAAAVDVPGGPGSGATEGREGTTSCEEASAARTYRGCDGDIERLR